MTESGSMISCTLEAVALTSVILPTSPFSFTTGMPAPDSRVGPLVEDQIMQEGVGIPADHLRHKIAVLRLLPGGAEQRAERVGFRRLFLQGDHFRLELGHLGFQLVVALDQILQVARGGEEIADVEKRGGETSAARRSRRGGRDPEPDAMTPTCPRITRPTTASRSARAIRKKRLLGLIIIRQWEKRPPARLTCGRDDPARGR